MALHLSMTPEERDDELRGEGYTEMCRRWEMLTEEDIWPNGKPTSVSGGRAPGDAVHAAPEPDLDW